MLVTEFSTGIVAASERFDLFADATSRPHMAYRLRSEDRHDFRATARLLRLEGVDICSHVNPHLELVRTPKLVRQSDPEIYTVHWLIAGRGRLAQDGRDTVFRPGQFVLAHSSHPLDLTMDPAAGIWSSLILQCLRSRMPLPENMVRRLTAVPIPAQHGMSGVLSRWLADLNTRAGEFTPADIPTLASVTLDLLASALAQCLEAEDALTPEARRNALRAQITTFVERHLADPHLTARTVADAHHISLRHLQHLLAEDNTTPAAWIRHRRLEHCRLDLTNPHLSTRPIHAIAARWGFANSANFARAFRTAYGIPPKEYRALSHSPGTVRGKTSAVPAMTRTS
ncbi:helix-turn-helix domain-containing protein [Streptomyces sp. NPDC020965]|uniref:AraC-like ligand-binding domain-containing protein n=1 Tax=Streptomyces sp. NPDC020965 TaxID=3365105 RepID=UPI003795414F